MSLLSTEQASIFLAPTELVLVRWRGLPRRIVDKQTLLIGGHREDERSAVPTAFAEALREIGCRRARVILSCHFTQCHVLPWRDDLRDDDEELAYARLSFADTYGDAAARWRIRLSDEPPGAPRLAVAVEADLLNAIEQAAMAAGTRLISMQPSLAAAAAHWRRDLDRRPVTWLVVHEERRACLALIECGRWRWARCIRVGDDWSDQLPEIIEHEMLLAGHIGAPADVVVFAPTRPALDMDMDMDMGKGKETGLSFRRLCVRPRRGFSPDSDGRFGLALIG